MDPQPSNPDRAYAVTPAPGDPEPTPPPLTPLQWLRANGFILLLLAALAAWIVVKFDWIGLWWAGMAVLGVGAVIFIHELGHFLAAKWCDVHVITFSIGFGPAIPGCSFRRGETLYKLALLPLGGYVNMVGEGNDSEEGEDYPRSFKNKSVYQRMLIISAGVVMNVLLGCLCFIVVYRYHGEPRPPAVVDGVEPGSPAWRAGVRQGMSITRVGDNTRPMFDDLKVTVATSREGARIPFVFQPRPGEGDTLSVDLTPRREEDDPSPIIGIRPPLRLQLAKARYRPKGLPVVSRQSAAEAARPVNLRPGDLVVGATDPDKSGEVTPLPGDDPVGELSRRMRKLIGKPLTLRVRRADDPEGKPATAEVPTAGFEPEDTIVGTTDPDSPAPYDPFQVKPLAPDPNGQSPLARDYFDFRRRMDRLINRPVVIQVVRKGSAPESSPVNLLVPPAFHYRLGVRMTTGGVVSVRDNSPATAAGVQPQDVLDKVVLRAGNESKTFAEFDPVRLPYDLRSWAAAHRGPKRIILTVTREGKTGQTTLDLPDTAWDESWDLTEETPLGATSPLSIPQIGLAYRVQSTVVQVMKNSPAERAGMKKGEVVQQIRYKTVDDRGPEWISWLDMKTKSAHSPSDEYEQWIGAFTLLQNRDDYQVQLKVSEGGTLRDVEMTAEEDTTWPLADRGLLLMPAERLARADTLAEAVVLGTKRTWDKLREMYLMLRGLGTGRVSAKKNIGGPLTIASGLFYAAAEDPFIFLLLLGMISFNLAVINFLPIPLLDGGHMVFLVYEALRGRPPSEAVRNAAAYVGGAVILSLMIFAISMDVWRKFFQG